MFKRTAFVALALCSLIASGVANQGWASDRRMIIANESSSSIVGLWGSNVGENSWQENILRGWNLPPGGVTVVNFDDGTGYCRFDLRAKTADGRYAYKYRVNVCAGTSWTVFD